MNPTVKTMRILGLTGGVGSGKSLAAQFFRKNGIPVIDLDQLGRDLDSKYPELIGKISQLLGENLECSGKLNRQRVREIVFKDRKKRVALESLLHPLIWQEFEKEADKLKMLGHRLILCEAALFIEHGHHQKFSELIVVMADEAIRRNRVKNRDHSPDSIIDQIFKSQTDDDTRRKLASHLLDNSGTPEQLEAQVLKLIASWAKNNFFTAK